MKYENDEDNIVQNLRDAGCDDETAENILNVLKDGKEQECLKMLAGHRRLLLEQLHEEQKQIDCLDYLVYRINNKQINVGKRSLVI